MEQSKSRKVLWLIENDAKCHHKVILSTAEHSGRLIITWQEKSWKITKRQREKKKPELNSKPNHNSKLSTNPNPSRNLNYIPNPNPESNHSPNTSWGLLLQIHIIPLHLNAGRDSVNIPLMLVSAFEICAQEPFAGTGSLWDCSALDLHPIHGEPRHCSCVIQLKLLMVWSTYQLKQKHNATVNIFSRQ